MNVGHCFGGTLYLDSHITKCTVRQEVIKILAETNPPKKVIFIFPLKRQADQRKGKSYTSNSLTQLVFIPFTDEDISFISHNLAILKTRTHDRTYVGDRTSAGNEERQIEGKYVSQPVNVYNVN